MSLSAAFALFFPFVMIRAGLGDLGTLRIPNRLILMLLAGYVVAVPLAGLTVLEVAWAVAAAAVVFALGSIAFILRWMGGGDVKLLAVTALWLGAGNVPAFIFYTSMFGAGLTVLVLIIRALHLPYAWLGWGWVARLNQGTAGVPYGVAIAAAGILVYCNMSWVNALF